jgi:hypothetical protein
MAKGGQNERDVSKFLTKWLTGTVKPYMFWRQEASGGLATVHVENVHMTGDIKHLHPDSKFFTDIFSIECKTGYPKTSFWQHFSKVQFAIEDFWLQTLEDATKSKKEPMLIYRKKGRKWIIGINRCIQEKLHEKIRGLNNIVINWSPKKVPQYDPKFRQNPSQDCILYDMESFFNKVKPDDIRRIHGNIKFDK